MPTRLTITDSTSFPIQTFFNAVSDSDLVHVVDWLTSGIGYHINDTHCRFPGDLDPGEESFEGVRFSLFEDSVIISPEQLREYLATVCRKHIVSYPDDEADLVRFLARPIN